MKKRQSAGKKDTSILVHIAFGMLLSLGISFLLSILVTVLIEKEVIPLTSLKVFMIGTHALSVFIGSILAISKEKGRIAIIAGMVAACYLLVLVCINMLVFSEGFDGLGTGILGMLAGGLIATLTKTKMFGVKKHHIKMRSR